MDVDGKVEDQFDKQVLKNNDVLGRVRKASPTEVVSNEDHVSCWRFWGGGRTRKRRQIQTCYDSVT